MSISVLKIIMLSQQEITEEALKILRSCKYSIGKVVIISPDKSIAEIPAVVCKSIIFFFISKVPQIFDNKDGNSSSISLAERVKLPDT